MITKTQAMPISNYNIRINTKGNDRIDYMVQRRKFKHNYSWNLDGHARIRASQRGFNYKIILMAIEYGEVIYKQGLTFYVVKKKDLPSHLSNSEREKLNNMVVVTKSANQLIKTCYKASNGIKHITRKSKTFY